MVPVNETRHLFPRLARHQSHVYALLALLIAWSMVLWVSNLRQQGFEQGQKAIAESTVRNAQVRIEELVAEKRRLVQVFADKNRALIHAVYRAPEKEGAAYRALAAEVKDFFPDHFSITVTDATGRPVIEDFEGYVGEVCMADMKQFIASGANEVRIHPNPHAYHVDIMAPWTRGGDAGLFFVGFKPDFIAKLLQAVQPLHHELILLRNDGSNMIEITGGGARNTLTQRTDFRLAGEELARVLHRERVAGAAWWLTDMRSPGLFEAERRARRLSALSVGGGVSLVIAALWLLAFRMERRRAAAERSLQHSLAEITVLNAELSAKHGELLDKQLILDEENKLAGEIFDQLTRRYPINQTYLRLFSQPMSNFNGDLVLAYERADGAIFVSVGDFTGHGLPAALGALPYADVFYAMARKASLGEMLGAINDKLCDLLPVSRFCCAVVLQADPGKNLLRVSNAAMPDLLVILTNGEVRAMPADFHPIGIRKVAVEAMPIHDFKLDEIDRIYLYSDGATELSDGGGELLGTARLQAFLRERPFSEVRAFLDGYRGNAAMTDDVTILEMDIQAMLGNRCIPLPPGDMP